MFRAAISFIAIAALLIFGLSFILLMLSGGRAIAGFVGLTMVGAAVFWIKEDFGRAVARFRHEPTE